MSEKKVRAIGEPRSLNETRDDLAEQVVALKGAAPDLALDCLREIEELCRALALKWHSFNDAMEDAKSRASQSERDLESARALLGEARPLLWAMVDPAFPGTSGLTIGEWDGKASRLVPRIDALLARGGKVSTGISSIKDAGADHPGKTGETPVIPTTPAPEDRGFEEKP